MATTCTIQELKAVNALMRGMTEKDALLEAGYGKWTAERDCRRIFKRPRVAAEIERRKKRMADKNAVTEDWIVGKLKEIAEAQLGDIIQVDADGNVRIDYTKLSPGLRNALNAMDISEYTEGRGADRSPVRNIKIRLHDKLKALEMLSRILGLFKDKVEVTSDRDLIAALHKGRERVNQEANAVAEDD